MSIKKKKPVHSKSILGAIALALGLSLPWGYGASWTACLLELVAEWYRDG